MLVVLASNNDPVAQVLVARWADQGAVLLTCADITQPGWRYSLPCDRETRATIGGRRVDMDDIRGVLNRLPFVNPAELTNIIPSEREYVCVEITAFLTWWLSQLKCPVLNRPRAAGLMGPNWPLEQWVTTAVQLGIPTRPTMRQLSPARGVEPSPDVPTLNTVTVVGPHCFGTNEATLADQARRLAQAAHVDVLAAHFTREHQEFVAADVWINAAAPEIADALLEALREAEC
jgi:hypothetical protein